MKLGLLVGDARHAELYSDAGYPVVSHPEDVDGLLVVGKGPRLRTPSVRVESASVLRADTRSSFVRSLHQIGSPFVDLRTFRVPEGTKPFEPVYGPGTSRPFLRTSSFHGLGRFVHRDDPQVRSVFHRLSSARRLSEPMGWIRPGFPAVPVLVDWDLDGERVEGILCSSIDRPTGFVILTAPDLFLLMGYDRTLLPQGFGPSDLEGLVPLECLDRLLDWTEQVLSITTSAGRPASTDVNLRPLEVPGDRHHPRQETTS